MHTPVKYLTSQGTWETPMQTPEDGLHVSYDDKTKAITLKHGFRWLCWYMDLVQGAKLIDELLSESSTCSVSAVHELFEDEDIEYTLFFINALLREQGLFFRIYEDKPVLNNTTYSGLEVLRIERPGLIDLQPRSDETPEESVAIAAFTLQYPFINQWINSQRIFVNGYEGVTLTLSNNQLSCDLTYP